MNIEARYSACEPPGHVPTDAGLATVNEREVVWRRRWQSPVFVCISRTRLAGQALNMSWRVRGRLVVSPFASRASRPYRELAGAYQEHAMAWIKTIADDEKVFALIPEPLKAAKKNLPGSGKVQTRQQTQ